MSWIERLELFGRATAIVSGDQRVSFHELARAAGARRHRLAGRIQRRVGVALSGPNGIDLIVELLALLELGAVPILAPPGLGSAALRAARRDARASWWSDGRRRRRWRARAAALPPRVRLVKLSSGSTGRPKSIALTGSAVLADGDQVGRALAIGRADRILLTLPMLHSYGFDFGFLQLLRGATVLLAGPTPRQVRAGLQAGATVLPAVPLVLELLVRHARGLRPNRLRAVISAAAPLEPATARAAERALGVAVRPHYGSSEAGALTLGRRQRWAGDVGRPLPGVLLGLRDRRLAAGGAQLALGYLRRGRLRRFGSEFLSRDRARIDRDGGVTLLGRTDRVVVRSSGTKQRSLTR